MLTCISINCGPHPNGWGLTFCGADNRRGLLRILWDDPEWDNGVRDSDAARAEQRAGKKYQETKESRQIAEHASVRSALEEKFAEKRWEAEENDRIADGLSTQAAMDEKLAIPVVSRRGLQRGKSILGKSWDYSLAPFLTKWYNTYNG